MTNKLAVYTISDPAYVGLAPTMFESVREHYPEADLYLFMIGKGRDRTFGDGVHVIYIEDVIEAHDLEQRLCYYLSIELATSVRPDCFKELFGKGYERVIYFDPDIYVFRRMTEADALLDGGANGIVTPHALRSISPGNISIAGGDRVLLQVGIFNLGFLALANTSETIRMLDWWQDKLKWQCICDTKSGLFVDQKWLEFLPAYFDGFAVLRLPTYNLAPWNADQYRIIEADGTFYVDTMDQPVAFIHFSGVKRMREHYKDMMGALEFYLKKIAPGESRTYNFIPYVMRTKRDGILWDKVCARIYQDYVAETGNFTISPLFDEKFQDHLTSTDPVSGAPIYLRKVFEIYPRYAVAVLTADDSVNYDNLLVEVAKPNTPYLGCIYPETVHRLRELAYGAPAPVPALPTQRSIFYRGVRYFYRRGRSLLKRSYHLQNLYAWTKARVLRLFHAQQVVLEHSAADARAAHKDMLLKIVLRQSKDADLVK